MGALVAERLLTPMLILPQKVGFLRSFEATPVYVWVIHNFLVGYPHLGYSQPGLLGWMLAFLAREASDISAW